MTPYAIGYKSDSDSTSSSCADANYCPGNGVSYTEYAGIEVNVATYSAKAAGTGCTPGSTSSNGGSPCYG